VNDEQLFRQQMADVRPLVQDRADITATRRHANFAQRRHAAVADIQRADNALSDAVQLVDNNAVVSFKRAGIQAAVFKKLRLGKHQNQARLDLHGMKIDQARTAVYQFIMDCQRYNLRTVVIVHGKGLRSATGQALLKSHTVHWLEQLDAVMAFHSAQAQDGGTGAVYVLLRKAS